VEQGNKSPDAPLRDEQGRLLPGSTANPSGRPKLVREFQQALRDRCYDKALDAITACLDDPDGKIRMSAVKEVFDRLFGKASQAITGADGAPLVPVDLAGLLSRAVGGEPKP
jgi:hypothetical protein